MSLGRAFVGLRIESDLAKPTAPNFLPPSWPPPPDFPIVIDANGNVVSRYSDSVWNLTPWAGRVLRLNFCDGKIRKNDIRISRENSDILRQVTAWWLYGPHHVRSARTLTTNFEAFRTIFKICSQHQILCTQLPHYPRLVDTIIDSYSTHTLAFILNLGHQLWEYRDFVGLTILDPHALQSISQRISERQSTQTPYIPPRIWLYQINRLRECLEDFLNHQVQIEACFHFCLKAYEENAGSLARACRGPNPRPYCPSSESRGHLNLMTRARLPFQKSSSHMNGNRSGAKHHGQFVLTAERFGIDGLLSRWVGKHESVIGLSSYFNLIGHVGNAYILNFSLMRISEALSLRSNCLEIETDPISNSDFHILHGATTKTLHDDDARWATSPSTALAVKAMTCVARLRMIAAEANPDVPTTPYDIENPFLVLRPYEPWRQRGSELITESMSTRPARASYSSIIARYPKLFDINQTSITQEDLNTASLLTLNLDPDIFQVGKPWPFAWHQLRRTGAVNMTASGIVSDASLQYQLKHANRTMTRYYSQGYYHLDMNLNKEACAEFIRTKYEMTAIDFKLLESPRFFSPHGEKRKEQILSIISNKDHLQLTKLATEGKIGYHNTLLGGCANPNPCPYGGVEHVARCGGGDGRPPCEDAIFDTAKEGQIYALRDVIDERILLAPKNSPLFESLQAQKKAVETALNAIKKQRNL